MPEQDGRSAGLHPPRRGGPALILVIDNYDSFTYNLVQLMGGLGHELRVVRNDQFELDEIERLAPTHLVLSPGPGRPENAGYCMDVIRRFHGRTPLLGVCLGHQAIATAFGARVERASTLVHGKASPVFHQQQGPFEGLPSPLQAGRYHSLAVAVDSLPADLEVLATTADGEIMGMRVRNSSTVGIQFHPESVLTPEGPRLVARFLEGTGPR